MSHHRGAPFDKLRVTMLRAALRDREECFCGGVFADADPGRDRVAPLCEALFVGERDAALRRHAREDDEIPVRRIAGALRRRRDATADRRVGPNCAFDIAMFLRITYSHRMFARVFCVS
jgi:hypothetical protein